LNFEFNLGLVVLVIAIDKIFVVIVSTPATVVGIVVCWHIITIQNTSGLHLIRNEPWNHNDTERREHARDESAIPQIVELLALGIRSIWCDVVPFEHESTEVARDSHTEIMASRQQCVHDGFHTLWTQLTHDHSAWHP